MLSKSCQLPKIACKVPGPVIAGAKGHFPAETHVTLLREVKAYLPADATVVLLGDGELDSPELQAEAVNYGWDYVCRTAKNIQISADGEMAGEYAQSLYANAEALAYYQAALTAGYPDAARLHERLGDLYTLRGEYQAALQSYETAAALDRSQPDHVAHLEHKLGQVYQRQGKRDLAESHFAAALRTLTEPNMQAHIYTDWSLSAQHRGDTDRALELARRALELAEASSDQRAHAQAHNVLGVLARHQSDLATAEHHL